MFKLSKRLILILAIIFCFCPVFTAYADAVYEPNNDFYNRYADECVYLGRYFQVNGGDGFATALDKPGSGKEIAALENGEKLYIQFSCLYKGEYWGIASFQTNGPSGERWLDGWIRMDELLFLYDYVAFDEEHLDEYYQYQGDYAEIKKAGGVVVWQWPGSGVPQLTIEDLDTENFWVSSAWVDKDGREWGFVTYLYGNRNIWVCLSDPLNSDIPAFNPASEPAPWIPETAHTDIAKSGNTAQILIIVVLVAALAAGTMILIRVFYKPNKNKG